MKAIHALKCVICGYEMPDYLHPVIHSRCPCCNGLLFEPKTIKVYDLTTLGRTLFLLGFILNYYGIDNSDTVQKTIIPPNETFYAVLPNDTFGEKWWNTPLNLRPPDPDIVELEMFKFWDHKDWRFVGRFGYHEGNRDLIYSEVR